jgi:hypothetical protein
MNPKSAATSITEITDRLANLLASENEILTNRKPRELALTLPEKERLTADYELHMTEIRKQPEMLDRLEQHDMQRLRKATHRFQDALEDHRRLVQATKSVTERMIKSVTDEVAKRNQPTKGYNKNAVMDAGFAGSKAQTVSLAVDQVV